jgi:hypothetical protein
MNSQVNKQNKKKLPQDLDASMTLMSLTKQKEFGYKNIIKVDR